MLHNSRLFCNIHVAVLPASAMLAVCYHIALLSMQGTVCRSGCHARAGMHLIKHTLSIHPPFAPVGLHSAVPLLD